MPLSLTPISDKYLRIVAVQAASTITSPKDDISTLIYFSESVYRFLEGKVQLHKDEAEEDTD